MLPFNSNTTPLGSLETVASSSISKLSIISSKVPLISLIDNRGVELPFAAVAAAPAAFCTAFSFIASSIAETFTGSIVDIENNNTKNANNSVIISAKVAIQIGKPSSTCSSFFFFVLSAMFILLLFFLSQVVYKSLTYL